MFSLTLLLVLLLIYLFLMLKNEIFEFFKKECKLELPIFEKHDLTNYFPIKHIDLENGNIVRIIYNDTVYTEKEDAEYKEFLEIIDEYKEYINQPKDIFRFYYKNNKNQSQILSNIASYKEYLEKNFQIIQAEELDKSLFNQSVNSTRSSKSRINLLELSVQNLNLSKIFNSKIFYIKGVDMKFHPNLYIDINTLSNNVKKILFRDFHRCFIFNVEYLLKHFMTPGKVENFNLIFNLNLSDYKQMSEFEIKYFCSEIIKTLNNYYPFRIKNIFLIMKPHESIININLDEQRSQEKEDENYFTSIKDFIIQVFSNSPKYIKNSVYVIDNGIETNLRNFIESYSFKIISLDTLMTELNKLDFETFKKVENENIKKSNLDISKEKSKIDSNFDKFENTSSKLSASEKIPIQVKKKESLKLAEKSDYNSIRSYKDYSIYEEVNTYENLNNGEQDDKKRNINPSNEYFNINSKKSKEDEEENYEFPTNANIDIYANELGTEQNQNANDDEIYHSYNANEDQFSKIENIKYTKQERVKGSNLKMGVYQSPNESKVNTNVNNTFMESNLETNRNDENVTGTDTNFFNSRNNKPKISFTNSQGKGKNQISFVVEQEMDEEKVTRNGSCCNTESCSIF